METSTTEKNDTIAAPTGDTEKPEAVECADDAKGHLAEVRAILDRWHADMLDMTDSVPAPDRVAQQYSDMCHSLWLATVAMDRVQEIEAERALDAEEREERKGRVS